MTAPKHTLIRRSLRRLTLYSRPLKRRSDRVQVIGRFVVVLSFLVAPPLAVVAATATNTHLQAVADAEAAERSRTRAVLLQDAPAPTHEGSPYRPYAAARVPVRAVWSVPGGRRGRGSCWSGRAPPQARPFRRGWIDRATSLGHRSTAPASRARRRSWGRCRWSGCRW